MIEFGVWYGILVLLNFVLVVVDFDFECICFVEFFVLNEIEFVIVLGMLVDLCESVICVVEVLVVCGFKYVFVMFGSNGLLLVLCDGVWYVLGVLVDVCDMMGVGDVYIGCFVCCYVVLCDVIDVMCYVFVYVVYLVMGFGM